MGLGLGLHEEEDMPAARDVSRVEWGYGLGVRAAGREQSAGLQAARTGCRLGTRGCRVDAHRGCRLGRPGCRLQVGRAWRGVPLGPRRPPRHVAEESEHLVHHHAHALELVLGGKVVVAPG